MFHFMSFSAPFVIGPDNPKLYWFSPDDMTPLINSPGHLQAINIWSTLEFGPEAMMGWGLTESWDYFLAGKAAMTFTWGDLGALAADPGARWQVAGQGHDQNRAMPGTMVYNIVAGADDAPTARI